MTSTNLGSIHGFHDEPPQFQGGVSIVRGDPPLPPVFQVGTPLLQGDPPKLQILFSCLELASTAPNFSLRMNCYDWPQGMPPRLQRGPSRIQWEPLLLRGDTLSPELAFRGVRVSLYGWAFTAHDESPWLQSEHLLNRVQEEPPLLHDELPWPGLRPWEQQTNQP
jgi:hypothetical protein